MSTTNDKSVKAWLSAGKPDSYRRERSMTQLSTHTPSNDTHLCRVLFDFAQKWAAENASDPPPTLIHLDEHHVALYVIWGRRYGKPVFNPRKAPAAAPESAQTAQEAASRKKFTRWRKSGGHHDRLDQFGRYATPEARSAWVSWQASLSSIAAAPGLSDEEMVSEYQNAYQRARDNGHGVKAAELQALRTVQAAMLPAQARLSIGITPETLADHISRKQYGLPLSALPDFRRLALITNAKTSLDFLGLSSGATTSPKAQLENFMAGIRSALERVTIS